MKTFSELTEGKQILKGSIFKGIDKICGKDGLRPIFSGAYITNGKIVASDSCHLIEIDLSFFGIDEQGVKDLNEKYIDVDILIELGKLKTNDSFFIDENGFNLVRPNTTKISRTYPIYNISEHGNYPNYKAIIPTEIKAVETFNLNAQLLLNVQTVYKNVTGSLVADLRINTFGSNKALVIKDKKELFLGLCMPTQI
jgi:hypothetical protein